MTYSKKRIPMKQRLCSTAGYFMENWKMIVHLLFKTPSFGVNNLVRTRHHSLFGARTMNDRLNVRKNITMMKIRAFSGFIPLNQAIELFPNHSKKHGYSPIQAPGLKTGNKGVPHETD